MNKNELRLLQLCYECGIFTTESTNNILNNILNLDLLESGIIDSMSLVMMTVMINDNYGIELSPQLFVAELRNLKSISAYLEQYGSVAEITA